MKRPVRVGDFVRYSSDWCRSVGALTGDIPFARGEVIEITRVTETLDLARVKWDQPDIPERVNVKNLERCRP